MPRANLAPRVKRLLPFLLLGVLCAALSCQELQWEVLCAGLCGTCGLTAGVSLEQLEISGNSCSVMFKNCPCLFVVTEGGCRRHETPCFISQRRHLSNLKLALSLEEASPCKLALEWGVGKAGADSLLGSRWEASKGTHSAIWLQHDLVPMY